MLSAFFFTYLNVKTYEKHPLRRKRITIRKINNLSVFQLFRYKKRQNAYKIPYMGKEKDITKNMLNTKKKKKTENTQNTRFW